MTSITSYCSGCGEPIYSLLDSFGGKCIVCFAGTPRSAAPRSASNQGSSFAAAETSTISKHDARMQNFGSSCGSGMGLQQMHESTGHAILNSGLVRSMPSRGGDVTDWQSARKSSDNINSAPRSVGEVGFALSNVMAKQARGPLPQALKRSYSTSGASTSGNPAAKYSSARSSNGSRLIAASIPVVKGTVVTKMFTNSFDSHRLTFEQAEDATGGAYEQYAIKNVEMTPIASEFTKETTK